MPQKKQGARLKSGSIRSWLDTQPNDGSQRNEYIDSLSLHRGRPEVLATESKYPPAKPGALVVNRSKRSVTEPQAAP